MKQKKITVLIPLYNAEKFIEKTLQSVFDSTSELYALNIIVSDNHSTDLSREIVNKFQDKLTIISPPHKMQIAEHWNFLSKYAEGDYIKFLCADDLILQKGIETQFKIIENDPQIEVVVNRRSIIDQNGKTFLKSHGASFPEGGISGKKAIEKSWRCGTNIFGETNAVMFSISAFKKGLPWEARYPYLLDLSHFRKSFVGSHLYISHLVTSAFRVHPGSLSQELVKIQGFQFRSFFREYESPDIKGYNIALNNILCHINSRKIQIKRRIFYNWVALKKKSYSISSDDHD